jgi:hypothetical protein
MGWGRIIPIRFEDGIVTRKAKKGEIYIHRNPRNKQEYYLIENRYRAGRDQALPASGLAIWHIDETQKNQEHQDATPEKHYLCSLIQADGRLDMEKSAEVRDANNNVIKKSPFYVGDETDLYPLRRADGSVLRSVSGFPEKTGYHRWFSWWNPKHPFGLEITEISDPGPEMTFVSLASSPPPLHSDD